MISEKSLKRQIKLIESLKARASHTKELPIEFFTENKPLVEMAFLIRSVETSLLDLFSKGKMNGTVHTCVGQELSAVAVCQALVEGDWMTSNHRCHGHFIAKTGRWNDLIDELLGLRSGVCGGIGSSQHLFHPGFISNGTQGSLLPVASGIAKSFVVNESANVAVSFIGEGTLGEGNIYEAMNLSAILDLPHVIICENNYYSQSTPQGENFRGDIRGRANSFGWEFYEADTWDFEGLLATCREAIGHCRENRSPVFINIHTYRLNAHSKGDDDREASEIDFFRKQDVIDRLSGVKEFSDLASAIDLKVKEHIQVALRSKDRYSLDEYIGDQLPNKVSNKVRELENPKIKLVKALRDAFDDEFHDGQFMIGEDLHDPYGGAFKVTLGLDEKYPGQIISSPISEAAITGFGIGMSMMGKKTFVEIMFGDFLVNAFDQLINNASKFFHMYAKQIGTNVTVRTPMGGGRGYGPTHSQSLEKFILGVDNLAVFSVTSMIDPSPLVKFVSRSKCPSVLLESKMDYGATLFQLSPSDKLDLTTIGDGAATVVLKPWARSKDRDCIVISYGAVGRMIADNYREIFEESDVMFELMVVQQLNPIPIGHVARLTKVCRSILIVEEGGCSFGWGSEMAYQLQQLMPAIRIRKIGARPVPIPSTRELESEVLISKKDIIEALIDVGRS